MFHIHRDRGHNTHGYSKSCLGCFNGSLYIFPFTRSMGKKWALGVLLIGVEESNRINCFLDRFAKPFFIHYLIPLLRILVIFPIHTTAAVSLCFQSKPYLFSGFHGPTRALSYICPHMIILSHSNG